MAEPRAGKLIQILCTCAGLTILVWLGVAPPMSDASNPTTQPAAGPCAVASVDWRQVIHNYEKSKRLESQLTDMRIEADELAQANKMDEHAALFNKIEPIRHKGVEELFGDMDEGIKKIAQARGYVIVASEIMYKPDQMDVPDITQAVIDQLNDDDRAVLATQPADTPPATEKSAETTAATP